MITTLARRMWPLPRSIVTVGGAAWQRLPARSVYTNVAVARNGETAPIAGPGRLDIVFTHGYCYPMGHTNLQRS
jgi:hypothetical protein